MERVRQAALVGCITLAFACKSIDGPASNSVANASSRRDAIVQGIARIQARIAEDPTFAARPLAGSGGATVADFVKTLQFATQPFSTRPTVSGLSFDDETEDPDTPPAILTPQTLVSGNPGAFVDEYEGWNELSVSQASNVVTVTGSLPGTSIPPATVRDDWSGPTGGNGPVGQPTGLWGTHDLNFPYCSSYQASTSHSVHSWWNGDNSAASGSTASAPGDCTFDDTDDGDDGDGGGGFDDGGDCWEIYIDDYDYGNTCDINLMDNRIPTVQPTSGMTANSIARKP